MISLARLACFGALASLSLALGGACGSSGTGNPLTSGAGAGASGDPGVTGGSSSSTGGGGDCKVGGAVCEAFNECCSGVCSNQRCTSCGNEGQACADGCCGTLTCYAGTCGACAADGLPCTLASECCSNECDQGLCAHCGGAGEACSSDTDCCAGRECGPDTLCCVKEGGSCSAHSDCCGGSSCTGGVCTACTGPTCDAVFAKGMGDPAMLCGAARDAYDAVVACLCEGACAAKCAQSYCVNMDPSDLCFTCLLNTGNGCGMEAKACSQN